MTNTFNLKSLVVGGIIGGMLTTGVGYTASQLTSIEVSMNPVTFIYNEEELELVDGKQSFIYDNTTYVPLRWLSESLGKTVEWDEQNRTIYIADQVVQEEPDMHEEEKQDEDMSKDENKQEEGTEEVAAELTLDQEAYAPTDTLQLTISNNGSSTLSFGRLFNIDMLKDGEWVEVPLNVAVTLELIILGENDTFTESLDLTLVDLQEGTYRLTKHVFDEVNGTVGEISTTFDIVAE